VRVLVDYEGVPGNYTGVPRAVHDDVLALLAAGFEITLWMSQKEKVKAELFDFAYAEEKEFLSRVKCVYSRPSNSRLWLTQTIPRPVFKKYDWVLTSLFPGIGLAGRRLIRMHDPFGHTGQFLREFFLIDGQLKLVMARSIRNAIYLKNIRNSLTITSSKFIADRVESIYESKGVITKVIPCAVGSSRFAKKSVTRENYFLIVGGQRQRKRPDLIVNTWASNFETLKVDLILIGQVPDSYLSEKALGLRQAGNLKILSNIPTARLRELQTNALACIFVSEGEGFGRPIAESLLVGTPVICNDLAVFDEFSSEHIRRFPIGDTNRLFELMKHFVCPISLAERDKILECGREFSYEAVGAKWRELLLGFNPRAPRD
jgi:glycosyltransferase involved in cell wall biosynthesis